MTQLPSETYLQIKEKAQRLAAQYENAGVQIPKGSGIDLLIRGAIELSDSWLVGDGRPASNRDLWRAAHLARVADAVSVLHGDAAESDYLRRLVSANLELLQREPSDAKNVLWELELLRVLRLRGAQAALVEPPDIVVAHENQRLGIACKKLYSEKNLEKVLSNGVAQIERDHESGVVALNLDDLIPAEKILVQPNADAVGRWLNARNLEFLHRHERHFRKYLASERIIAVLVSTGVVTDIRESDVRLNNARQSTVWMFPELSPQRAQMAARFKDLMLQQ